MIAAVIEVDLLLFRAGNFASARRCRKQEIEPTRRGAVRTQVCRLDSGVVHRRRRNASPTLALVALNV